MKLLSISTSTALGSVAVLDGDRVLASTSYNDPHGHAERLFEVIDEVLLAAGADRLSVTAVACDVGPGSFTGVRVGVASAKGIALALNIPAVGVMSLEAIAAAAFDDGRAGPDDVVAAVLDAKKGELFMAAFDASLLPLLEPLHVARDAADDVLRPLAEARSADAHRPGRLVVASELDPTPSRPEAAWIGRIAASRLEAAAKVEDLAFADAAALEALYVRAPDAKLPASGLSSAE